MPATPQPGATLYGCTLDSAGRPQWFADAYVVGTRHSGGGLGDNFLPTEQPSNPCLLKLFNGLDTQHPKARARRIKALVQDRDLLYRTTIRADKQSSFVAWPRRLLVADRAITGPNGTIDDNALADRLVGFTMDLVRGTADLESIISGTTPTTAISKADAFVSFIALIAQQLNTLHRHPWSFVFTDLNTNNILVDVHCRDITFIDADSYQFTPSLPAQPFHFTSDIEHPNYTSPEQQSRTTPYLTYRHDDFVLAIIIYQLLMLRGGSKSAHPFRAQGNSRAPSIAARDFTPPRQPKRKAIWDSIPTEIQAAFKQTFNSFPPLTALEWAGLLHRYAGRLRRP